MTAADARVLLLQPVMTLQFMLLIDVLVTVVASVALLRLLIRRHDERLRATCVEQVMRTLADTYGIGVLMAPPEPYR